MQTLEAQEEILKTFDNLLHQNIKNSHKHATKKGAARDTHDSAASRKIWEIMESATDKRCSGVRQNNKIEAMFKCVNLVDLQNAAKFSAN